MPIPSDQPLTTFARTNFRDWRWVFGIKKTDRRFHMYVVGQTGAGKTTMLERMLTQDIHRGEGLALLDPHGDLVERLVAAVPAERRSDLIFFNPADPTCPYGFNPLASVPPERRSLAASGILESFENLWSSAWGVRLEHILRNSLLALLEQPSASFVDIPRLYGEDRFRSAVVARVTNPEVRRFWTQEFAEMTPSARSQAVAPILNKLGAFLTDPRVYRAVSADREHLDLRNIMDSGKLLLVTLAKGRLGGVNTATLGALLVSGLELAALSRAEIPEAARRDFYVYLDEFQNFMTKSMATMLSELRKYRLCLILAHQFLGQLSEEVRQSVLGNVGTVVSFRVGLEDAKHLEKLFAPVFVAQDLVNLPNYEIYLRLMIDGSVSKGFSAETVGPG